MLGRERIDAVGRRVTEHTFGHRRPCPRADRVGPYAVAREPTCGRQRQRRDSGFCSAVVGLPFRSEKARLRRSVDDAPVHRRPGFLGFRPPVGSGVAAQEEMAAKMNFEYQIPVFVRHVEQHPVAHDAGIVDDDVDTAELPLRCFHQCVGGRTLTDVACHEFDFGAETADLLERCFDGLVRGQIVDDQRRTGLRQTDGLELSEPRSGTGHDGDLAFETGFWAVHSIHRSALPVLCGRVSSYPARLP